METKKYYGGKKGTAKGARRRKSPNSNWGVFTPKSQFSRETYDYLDVWRGYGQSVSKRV